MEDFEVFFQVNLIGVVKDVANGGFRFVVTLFFEVTHHLRYTRVPFVANLDRSFTNAFARRFGDACFVPQC